MKKVQNGRESLRRLKLVVGCKAIRRIRKAAGAWDRQPYHLHVPIVLKSGSLNLLEPSGPVQAYNGTALP